MGGLRSAVIMPLLSTLAALVILVNSAEEGLHADLLHHESSPRLPEPGSPDYDQSWRAIEVQPMMEQQPEPMDEWGVEIAPLEPPKRRRPGRKRKRRPQQPENPEDLVPEEHRQYLVTPYQETDLTLESPEPQRRRRKRPDGRTPNRWNDEFHEQQRPLRRRGHRRKVRPVSTVEPEDQANGEELSTIPQEHITNVNQEHYHIDNTETHTDTYLDEGNDDQITLDDAIAIPMDQKQRDSRSESNTSVDRLMPEHREVQETYTDEITTSEKHDKSYRVPYSLARKQDQTTGEKSLLKELLKQSGGLSLSELLQQRNLSLSDLLNGKQNAISALRSDSIAVPAEDTYKEDSGANQKSDYVHTEEKHDTRDSSSTDETIRTPEDTAPEQLLSIKPLTRRLPSVTNNKSKDEDQPEAESNTKDNRTSEFPRRRLPPSGTRRNIRKRIRNPPVESTTLRIRPQYNFVSSHARRRENATTSSEPKPSHEKENLIDSENINATTKKPDEPTTTANTDAPATTEDITTTILTTTLKDPVTDKPEEQTEQSDIKEIKVEGNEIEKSKLLIPALRPRLLATNSELRRQAQSNRQLKKKLRNKTVIIPTNAEEIAVQDLFGMANLVSASEFITKVQSTPSPTTTTTTTTDLPDLFTDNFEDLEAENIVPNKDKPLKEIIRKIEIKVPKYTTVRHRISTIVKNIIPSVTTEESAKEEILEVFKDMHGGARLAKILSERNMTINELVEHRERGSSQIHLADIFHNASREPNPPEPFLSKSLIEPISKETYPLRALLEANNHDPTVKVVTQNPYSAQFTNIPLIVDYGRNIHENGENLGIVALFNDISNSKPKYEGKNIKKDSEGTAYFTSIMSLNATEDNFREGRSMVAAKKPESVSSIPTHLQRHEEKLQQTNIISTTQGTPKTTAKTYAEKDVDGDGVIILEDLQHLNELDNHIAQAINEKLEVKTFENSHSTDEMHGILGSFPSGVRSATIASATIVGVATILFLLTYVGCKWRERRKNVLRKDSFRCEQIPTPVFENRKSNRNCSNRSISPMLASSNGFTMSTLDSQTGKESPDYMWDTLHKPFQ